MNPFEEINDNNTLKNNVDIEIWVETFGRKSNTYISGLLFSLNELKEHVKTMKRNIGCNGTIKKYMKDDNEIDVILLQGEHTNYVVKYLIDLNISKDNIHIRG